MAPPPPPLSYYPAPALPNLANFEASHQTYCQAAFTAWNSFARKPHSRMRLARESIPTHTGVAHYRYYE